MRQVGRHRFPLYKQRLRKQVGCLRDFRNFISSSKETYIIGGLQNKPAQQPVAVLDENGADRLDNPYPAVFFFFHSQGLSRRLKLFISAGPFGSLI